MPERAVRQGLGGPTTTSNLTGSFDWARCDLTGSFDWARCDLTGRGSCCHEGVEDDRDDHKSLLMMHDHQRALARKRATGCGQRHQESGWGWWRVKCRG